MQEILQRSERKKQERNRKTVRSLTAAAVALSVLMIGAVMWRASCIPVEEGKSMYGAFLLSAEAGGFILIAVISFAAGAAVTMLLNRIRKNDGHTWNAEHKESDSDR